MNQLLYYHMYITILMRFVLYLTIIELYLFLVLKKSVNGAIFCTSTALVPRMMLVFDYSLLSQLKYILQTSVSLRVHKNVYCSLLQ